MSALCARLRALQSTKLYDLVAAMPFIAWCLLCAKAQGTALVQAIGTADLGSADAVFLAQAASGVASLLFICLVLVLLVVRQSPKGRAQGLFPRVAALAGTYLGLAIVLLPRRELGIAPSLASAGLGLTGTVFALYAVRHLGRSVSLMAEARALVTDGPYGSIRHPLYLGEGVTLLGVTLNHFSAAAVAILVVQMAFQLHRMRSEEGILGSIFPEYGAYCARTARLVPGLY